MTNDYNYNCPGCFRKQSGKKIGGIFSSLFQVFSARLDSQEKSKTYRIGADAFCQATGMAHPCPIQV